MKHLTESEQNEWLLGERAPATAEHLRQCAECREKLAAVESGLGQFRAASLAWSAEHTAARVAHPLPKRDAPRAFAPAWAAGCAAAALAVTLGLVELHPRSATQFAAPNPTPSLSDDALLEQIDKQVSGNVPEAMQPLARYTASLAAATR